MDDQQLTPFEQRLSARLTTYAEQADVSVDAAMVAHSVATAWPRPARLWSLQRPRLILQFAMVVVLLMALVVAALLVGAINRPNPLGRNGLIAFTTNGGIAFAYPDGSGLRILPTGGGEAFFPTWSPDGTTLAYWSKPSNLAPLSLVVLDPKTNATTVVSGSLNIQSDPALILWASDGRHLVFPAIIGQGDPEVYVAAADGSDLRSLAPQLQPSDPAWSPDGTQIAFRGRSHADLDSVGLYVVGVEGVSLRLVTVAQHTNPQTQPWTYVQLNWSPDGEEIAYASIGPFPVGGYVIGVADVASGATHDLTAGDYDGQPLWSPDGRWVAFLRGPVNGAQGVGLIRPDGSDLRILAGAQTSMNTISWSPDGTSIAAYSPDHTQVEVIPIDGSLPLTFPAPGANSAPSWQRLP
jgi:Tol biopolymer transport system component